MALLLSIPLLMLSNGCDPGHEITYINKTSFDVEVFWGNGRDATVAPGEEVESGLITYSGTRLFRAVTVGGDVVYSRGFSWNDLEALNFRIEITASAQPTPSATP